MSTQSDTLKWIFALLLLLLIVAGIIIAIIKPWKSSTDTEPETISLTAEPFPDKFSLKNVSSGNYLGSTNGVQTNMNYFKTSQGKTSDTNLISYYSGTDGKQVNCITKDGSFKPCPTDNLFSAFKDKDNNIYIKSDPKSDMCLDNTGNFVKCAKDAKQQWKVVKTPPLPPVPMKFTSASGIVDFGLSGTDKCILPTGDIGTCNKESALYYERYDANSPERIKIYSDINRTKCLMPNSSQKIAFDTCTDNSWWNYNTTSNNRGLFTYSDTGKAVSADGSMRDWYELPYNTRDFSITDPFTSIPGMINNTDSFQAYFTIETHEIISDDFLKSLIGKKLSYVMDALKAVKGYKLVISDENDKVAIAKNIEKPVKIISTEVHYESDVFSYIFYFSFADTLEGLCSITYNQLNSDAKNPCDKMLPFTSIPILTKIPKIIQINDVTKSDCVKQLGKKLKAIATNYRITDIGQNITDNDTADIINYTVSNKPECTIYSLNDVTVTNKTDCAPVNLSYTIYRDGVTVDTSSNSCVLIMNNI